MKKIPLITLLSFFILIPYINAEENYEEKTTHKYHYYYFSQPFSETTIEDLLKGGTTNYTRFANYREWEIPSATQMQLKNNCAQENSKDEYACWNLAKFYAMWEELENGTVVCKNDTCSRDLKEKGEERYYHAHGAYSSNTPIKNDWNAEVKSSDSSPNDKATTSIDNLSIKDEYVRMACATLQTDNTLERVDDYGNKVSDSNKYYNTYISIKRSPPSGFDTSNISWKNYVKPGNVPTCSDDSKKIKAYDENVYSPVLYRVTTTATTYNCKAEPLNIAGTCNNTVTGSTACDKKTITVTEDGGGADDPNSAMARAVVSFKQDYSMTNILTPTTIYQGGGVKIGFIYNTKVTVKQESIEYDNANGKHDALQNKINEQIRKSIIKKFIIESNIKNKASLYFLDEKEEKYTINPAQMQVECDQQGDIINDKEVTTTCTILLPESEVELGTGKVTYKNSIGKGINNEFYTPIKYNGDLYLNVKLEDLGTTTELWNPDIKITYNGKSNSSSNCTVSTYPRFYEEDNKTYKFIYRPIDLNNPFPNRNAGINWYDWYSVPYNKNRLKSSYDKIEYTAELDNQIVSKIKEYNKNNNNNYLDWRGISETGKSEFIENNNFMITYGGGTP